MRAMILSAGFGTRLRPATNHLPKPCFPILGKPLIVHIIEKLKNVGVHEIVINLHYLPDIVKETLEHHKVDGVTIHFSYEKDILGTAGGIKKVEHLLRGESFILHNGDIYSEVDLADAVRFHEQNSSAATMIVKVVDPTAGDTSAFIGIDDKSKITRFPYGETASGDYARRALFTGIHILEPTVFDYIPDGIFYGINDRVYPDMLADGHKAYGYVTDAYWHDIGKPADYIALNARLLDGDAHIGSGTQIADGCTIGPNAVIGTDCVIESGCRVNNSVIFDGVKLEKSVVVTDSIILKNCKISALTEINNTIITDNT